MEKKKTYLVTYTDGNIVAEKAIEVLGVAKTRYKDGVALMETEAEPAANDVLHFENLGVTRLSLSAEEAKKIAEKTEVLAVEEDCEVFPLYDSYTEDDLEGLEEIDENSLEYEDFDEDFLLEELLPEAKRSNRRKYKPGKHPLHHRPFISPQKNLIMRRVLRDVYRSLLRNIPNKFRREETVYQEIPWNISLVQAPSAWRRKIDGRGVKVAVLDTGIANHVDLTVCGGASFVPDVSSYDDDHGHGTHCAGIIAARNNGYGVVGVAPKAMLYAVKVLPKEGSGLISYVIAGLEWCIRHKMNVASMSLGSPRKPIVAMATIIKRCQDSGITVVASAGNSYGRHFPWVGAPANSFMQGEPNASPIAVGAVDRNGVIAPFSSRGSCVNESNPVTCVAPGVSVESTCLNNSYTKMSGTSMACPHVSGLAALIIQRYPSITPAQVKRLITRTAIDLGDTSNDSTFGFGLINCDEATR